MRYLAFGTVYRSSGGTVIGAPYKVYAVTHDSGRPPYYRVVLNGSEPQNIDLDPGTNEFNKVEKWVGGNTRTTSKSTPQRRILNDDNATCHISLSQIHKVLTATPS